jgi:hypothetical protein
MRILFCAITTLAGSAGCGGSDASSPSEALATVARVSPDPGATNVDPAEPIVIEFSHVMRSGMEQYIDVHEGSSLAGPVVAGTWHWSGDHATATFTPDHPLRSQTQYLIHVGGGIRDRDGQQLDHENCTRLGGAIATQERMHGGEGRHGGAGMMGSGWQHSDGTWGMTFAFTT